MRDKYIWQVRRKWIDLVMQQNDYLVSTHRWYNNKLYRSMNGRWCLSKIKKTVHACYKTVKFVWRYVAQVNSCFETWTYRTANTYKVPFWDLFIHFLRETVLQKSYKSPEYTIGHGKVIESMKKHKIYRLTFLLLMLIHFRDMMTNLFEYEVWSS